MSLTLPEGAAGSGQFDISVMVDSANTLFEYNAGDTAESNNAATATFDASLADYADLQTTGLDVTPNPLHSGDAATISWTDANVGSAATGRFTAGGMASGLLGTYYTNTAFTGTPLGAPTRR